MSADRLMLATGHNNRQDVARILLGDEVTERIGPVWGFDDDGRASQGAAMASAA